MPKDKDDKRQLANMSRIRDLSSSIQKLSDDIYSDTYYTPADNNYSFQSIKDGISKSLDNILQRNMDINGRPNISNVYRRAIDSQNKLSDKALKDFDSLFEDQQLLGSIASSYSSNTYIKQYDSEIDLICKYMPKLDEAIEVKKDMVLCADQFSRDFLTVKDKSSIEDSRFFDSEIDIIKEKYNLADILETSVYRAWKYGEDFLYIIPYNKAFNMIFKRRETDRQNMVQQTPVVQESVSFLAPDGNSSDPNKKSEFNFTVTFNRDNALTESIKSIYNAVEQLKVVTESSINESVSLKFSDKVIKEAKENGLDFTTHTSKLSKHVIPDDTVPTKDDEDRDYKALSSDGTFDTSKSKDDKVSLLKIPGCLVKRLEREKVIPIYIEDLCMGYYYIEIDDDTKYTSSGFGFNQPTLGMLQGNQPRSFGLGASTINPDPIKDDAMLKNVAAKLSELIDKQFINNNQDLYREIYMILKYDEKFNRNTKNVNITFIPPDDIEHVYFNMDPRTHRGISLLDRALIPAKIFIALTMSDTIGMLTRGQDKRVYYVRQQVETNISKTLLSAINQIKKGNFGVRNIENLMSVLNITGQYNDYFIPKSANGDSPIDFEVLEGQKIDPNMEFLEKFESYAVGTTGVPLELIEARLGIDYATQLTMTNAKHMRMVYKDQSKVQTFGGRIITKIYNAEFSKTSQLALFLPPPLYITLTNNTQLITNVTEYAEKVVGGMVKAEGGDDDMVTLAVNEYIRRTLGTYIDFNMIDDIVNRVKVQSSTKNNNEE